MNKISALLLIKYLVEMQDS